MKKIIITQLLLFIAITAFSQTPSKEETIEWIKTKLLNYGYSNDRSNSEHFISFFLFDYLENKIVEVNSDADITWDITWYVDRGYYYDKYVSIISLNDIIDASILKNAICLHTYGKKVEFRYGSPMDAFFLYLKWDMEPDLKDRFLKAFKALAEYNKQKNEVF